MTALVTDSKQFKSSNCEMDPSLKKSFKSQLERQTNETITQVSFLPQQRQTCKNSVERLNQVEISTIRREKALKRRIQMQHSRNKDLEQKLTDQGIVKQEKSFEKNDFKMPSPTQQFGSVLVQRSDLPRLTNLSLVDKTKTFRHSMIERKQIFLNKFGEMKFNDILSSCVTHQDREVINEAYQLYMKSIYDQSTEEDSERVLESNDSLVSFVLREDGGEELKPSDIVGERQLQRYIDAVHKKLGISKQRMYDSEIVLPETDDESSEHQLSHKQRVLQPANGPDEALEKIYFYKRKFDSQIVDESIPYVKYTSMLEDSCAQKQIAYDARPKQGSCRRGFLVYPEQMNLNKVNVDEVVLDPGFVFDNYGYKRMRFHKTIGEDFGERLEWAKLSSIYKFNSTIYELNPTGKSALITEANHSAELALPILAKIKNFELILADYRLEVGHFCALKAAFMIEPKILTKITLQNCGLDNESFKQFLDALFVLDQVTSIKVIRGSFCLDSISRLKHFIQQTGQLEELVLRDVQVQLKTAEAFLEMLNERSYLQILTIINFEISERAFVKLTEYVSHNQYLNELSIQNLKGLRVESWLPFFQRLAFNKQLKSLDLSHNNFIEAQLRAMNRLTNPYTVFKQMFDKFIKAGPGARWPPNPLDIPNGIQFIIQQNQLLNKKPINPNQEQQLLAIPNFKRFDELEANYKRFDQMLEEDKDIDEAFQHQQLIECCKLMKQAIKIAMATAFVSQLKTQLKVSSDKDAINTLRSKILDVQEEEYVSNMAMVITEAIYKFVRRNTNLQHLDLTRCNLSQVMIGRIGLGVKCSKSMMGVHFSDNPGVTPAVLALLQVKFKAKTQEQPAIKITNAFVEQGSKLNEKLAEQIRDLEAVSSLAQETIAIRDLNRRKFGDQQPAQEFQSFDSKTLVLTRLIGHKLTIPNSGRWVILTKPKQECWICKRHIVSLIFWSPQIGKSQVHAELGINKDRVFEQLDDSEEKQETPIIYGEFTNWQPKHMTKVKDFSELPRMKEPPNFMHIVRQKYDLGPGFDTFSDLNEEHQKEIRQMTAEYANDTTLNWRRHIGAFMKWKDPQLTNYEFLERSSYEQPEKFDDLTVNPIYVYAALCRPGKQYYAVKYSHAKLFPNDDESSDSSSNESDVIEPVRFLMHHPEQSQDQLKQLQTRSKHMTIKTCFELESDFYLHKCIVPLRDEPIPKMYKNYLQEEITRTFDKKRSVWKPWKPDTKKTITNCVANDLLGMNIAKLVKTTEDQAYLNQVITKNMRFLKNCHLDLLCETNIPPYISELDFVRFYRDSDIPDENIKAANIDLIYVQVNTNVKSRTGLNRGEFIETLLRIARSKYIDTGICKQLGDAFQMLVDKIQSQWVEPDPHVERVKMFWTVDVNDCLDVNKEGLFKVFASFMDLKQIPKKKHMDLKEAADFFTQQMPNLKVNVKVARKSYVMAKMTVDDEQKKINDYMKLVFVEFLEMLCRVALWHFDDYIYQDWSYMKKLQNVVENVLGCKGIERREVVIQQYVESDADISDCDY